ncbi:histidine kinase dimerization/phosphoacceptor domain -containing protein [Chitinophaga agri]|uniref:histidine kinase n=1 Tax=Chitinophaga agri TaxID=2703787 RepID=A0A6B9ZID9_9BACT|nr:histidine kinase dimerization/phosphoacceptor domain -containing protein [Chitinophaga agri]QHS61124.1 tetratricopeptide repeat protein [Chitinophaga agri]
MNRLLLLVCVFVSCMLQCVAQDKLPTAYAVLHVSMKKEKPQEEDVKILSDWGQYFINRPGVLQTDIDSALLCAKKILTAGDAQQNERWRGNAYLIYSQVFREKDEKTLGREYAEKAVAAFGKTNLYESQADAYVELSRYISYEDAEYIHEAIRYQENAVRLYGRSHSYWKQAETLNLLADYVISVPDNYKAIELLHQAEAIYKSIGYKKLGRTYDLLGFTYKEIGEQSKALEYQLLAVKVMEADKDSSQTMSTCYNSLGMLYYEMEEFRKSVAAYEKAFVIATKLKDTVSLQYLTSNLATTYIRMKNGKEALRVLKNMESRFPPTQPQTERTMYAAMVHAYLAVDNMAGARPYVQRLEEKVKKTGYEDVSRFFLLTPVATYYFKTQQYERAIKACENIEVITNKYGLLAESSRNYRMWYRVDSAMGNYVDALKHFNQFKSTSDSLFSSKKASQINNLQIKFDTEQKDHNLKLKQQSIELLTRDALLQKAELKRARTTRNFIIAGASLLVVLLVLGYNRYKTGLRRNQQLKLQQDEINEQNLSLQALIGSQDKLLQEKEWLVKEIHHRVKNNLQIVMSLLNTQAAFLDDKDALNAIRESRFRMQAISLIHQKLYQSENMALIDMHVYIHDLVSNLQDGFARAARIRFDLQIARVKLDVSQSVPVGLILNEAITNAIKYAFSDTGTIFISLHPTGDGKLTLAIADNGNGFVRDAGKGTPQSMGLTLMHTLSEQLDGTLDIRSDNGVSITVEFSYHQTNDADETETSGEYTVYS